MQRATDSRHSPNDQLGKTSVKHHSQTSTSDRKVLYGKYVRGGSASNGSIVNEKGRKSKFTIKLQSNPHRRYKWLLGVKAELCTT